MKIVFRKITSKERRQRLVGFQWGTTNWWLLGSKIVDRERFRDQEDVELGGSDVIEIWGLFLLDQVFEDADIFGLRNLDRERLVRLVTFNETVEAELAGVG